MDAWEPYAVREHCCDAVRYWAELEGKSPEMTAELIQQRTASSGRKLHLATGALALKLLAWAAEALWQITRR
jgi:hypothetical protein